VLEGVIQAFRDNGGGSKPVYVQAKHQWAETDEAALEMAFDQWKTNVFASKVTTEFNMPDQFEKAARYVRPEDVKEKVCVSSDPGTHVERIRGLFDVGADAVYIHQVGKNQEAFVETFGEKVLPEFDLAPLADVRA
jgi:alkanesulfonate monooxygenase SsuD/methylene tetrahydromethanopterin reductase-like flavin-dependent oxidoreductase (luciferase family)